jgi:hypothetical protein
VNVIGRFDHVGQHSLFVTTSAKPETSAELVCLGRRKRAHERRRSSGAGSPQRQCLDLTPRPVDHDLDLGLLDQARRTESETLDDVRMGR